MSNNRKRKPFIDIAKGIGIYIIVLVHCTQGGSALRQYLLSFCVPLFFIISGMLFSYKRELKPFMINMIQKIAVPFVIYGIIDAFFTLFRVFVMEGAPFSIMEVIKIFARITFISGGANSNGPLWYLPVLMWIQLIMYYPARSKYKWAPAAAGVLMFIAGYFIRFKGPFRVGQIPAALVFFTIGFYIKPWIMKLEQSKAKYPICPAAIALSMVICYINGFAEMAALNYGRSYMLYYIVAVSVTVGVLALSMMIKENRLLEFLGVNSLTIMCTHYHFARYIIPWILQAMNKEYILESIPVEIVLSIVLTAFVSLLVIIINKKAPVLTGAYKFNLLSRIENGGKK